MRSLKIIGTGCLSAGGVAGGLALGGLSGAALVAVSLFVAVVAVGLAVAGLVGALETRRIRIRRPVLKRTRRAGTKSRCRSCGRKRGSFDGVLVCPTCDGITETTGTISENTLPG